MITEFELPDELIGVSYESILQKMKSRIPAQYDAVEGGFVHDMLAPNALEEDELVNFWLPLALQTMSHIWATGRWLDYHAADCGMIRRPATCATGTLQIETSEEVSIPEGFIFCIPGDNGVSAQDFIALEEVTGSGTLEVRIQAADAGTVGNVKADTITIMKTPLRGIVSITNPERLTGGVAAESDDSLRKRIDDFYAGRGASFVGNKKDYIRWAKEVPGVSYAHCLPCYFGKNTVKLVIADGNGDPATEELCKAVEKHIFGTGHEDLERLAPIGVVRWEVAPPELFQINISAEIKLAEDFDLATVEDNLRADLLALYKSLADDDLNFGALKYTALADVFYHCAGIADFKNILVNGATENIPFAADFFPATGTLELISYD